MPPSERVRSQTSPAHRVACIAATLLAACSPHRDLPLLDVEGVLPSVLEPGDPIRVTGQGFPVGQRAELTLEGTFFRPGQPPLSLSETLEGDVHDSQRIEYMASTSWVRSLGRGTFEGVAKIEIDVPDQPFAIRGRTSARFDVVPEEAASAVVDDSDSGLVASRASDTLRTLGIMLEEARGIGLRVTTVVQGGPAQRSGLRTGDVIREVDGLQLLALEDFAPQALESASLVVQRPGVPGLHTLRLRASNADPARTPAPWWFTMLIGLVIGLYSPARMALSDRTDHRLYAKPTFSTRLTTVAFVVAVSYGTMRWWWSSSASSWVVVLAVLLSASCFRRGIPHALRDYAYLLASVGTMLLLSGGHRVVDIVDAQGALPLAWWVCVHLAALLAFGVYVHSMRQLVRTASDVFARLYVAVASVLGGILFLGGWAGLGLPSPEASAAGTVGVALYLAVKASLVYAVPFMLSSVPRAMTRTAAVAGALAVITVTTRFELAPVWSYALLGFCIGMFLHWLRLSIGRSARPQLLTAP